jgi:ankyrin repeat protein
MARQYTWYYRGPVRERPYTEVVLKLAALLLALSASAGDLHQAVRSGDTARVRVLLREPGAVNAVDAKGGTPLHDAVWAGEREIAELLIAAGADVNARHAEAGSTPLHYAIVKGHADIAALLLENGAVVGVTSLHLAAARGSRVILELLLDHGADVKAIDNSGATALDEACWKGQPDAVRVLLARGADARTRNRETGMTPLHEAAVKGHGDIVALLLAAGADAGAKDNAGETALDAALGAGQRSSVEALMGRSVSTAPLRGASRLLREAILRGRLDSVTMLLDLGADVNAAGPEASTPLDDACLKGNPRMVDLLLSRGAKVNLRTPAGATALHEAALSGNPAVITLLLDRGAEIDARDRESSATPLHYAVSMGRREAVELLLSRGAERAVKYSRGKTAMDVAVDNGLPEIVELLRKAPPLP